MKKMKKMLALFLALVMCISLLNLTVLAVSVDDITIEVVGQTKDQYAAGDQITIRYATDSKDVGGLVLLLPDGKPSESTTSYNSQPKDYTYTYTVPQGAHGTLTFTAEFRPMGSGAYTTKTLSVQGPQTVEAIGISVDGTLTVTGLGSENKSYVWWPQHFSIALLPENTTDAVFSVRAESNDESIVTVGMGTYNSNGRNVDFTLIGQAAGNTTLALTVTTEGGKTFTAPIGVIVIDNSEPEPEPEPAPATTVVLEDGDKIEITGWENSKGEWVAYELVSDMTGENWFGLTVKLVPESDEKITKAEWTSDNTDIVTVGFGTIGSSGVSNTKKVTGIADGETTLTVKVTTDAGNTYEGKIPVTVKNSARPTVEPEPDYVAQIGDTKYETLAEAITVAGSGDTVVLLADVTVNETYSSNASLEIRKALTIDGQGQYTITCQKEKGIRIFGVGENEETMKVILKDVTVTNANTLGRAVETRGGNVELVLDNATLTTTGTGNTQVFTVGGNRANATTVTIKNGSKLIASQAGYGIITFNPVDMTIDNSEVSGYGALLFKKPDSSAGSAGSKVNIVNGATVSSAGIAGPSNSFGTLVFQDNNITVNVKDSTVEATADPSNDPATPQAAIHFNNYYGNPTGMVVKISGNSCVKTVNESAAFVRGVEDGNTITVYDGAYSTDVTEYCVEGFKAAQGEDGLYHIVERDYVAQIGETKYETLDDAITAAKPGDTVTLLADVTTATELTLKAGVTLDGDGHTVTNNTGRVLSATGAKVRNLTINASGNGYAIYTNGDTTVENCTFDGTTNWQPIYVNDEGAPNVVVTGCTFNTTRSMVIRSNTKFTNNVLNGEKGLTIAGNVAGAVVTGNTFNNARLDVYPIDNAKVTIEKNKLLGSSYVELEDKTYDEPVDLSRNYWGGEAPAEMDNVTVDTWYTTTEMEDTITLSEATQQITVGDTTTLTVSGGLAGKTEWTSSDVSVATVDANGVVTAVSNGTAEITATVGDATATCEVTVTTAETPSTPSTPSGPSTPSQPDTPPEVEIEESDVPLAEMPLPFEDIYANDWYREAVAFVYSNRLLLGVSDTRFAPRDNTTRGMMATVFYRLEKEPSTAFVDLFGDVVDGKWYSLPITWAQKNGVVKGYGNGDYGPNDDVTREQIVTMLYRYAQGKGFDVSGKADLSVFADSEAVSDYAVDAMAWAVSNGIVQGRGDNTLAPGANAMRLEIALIFQRFVNLYLAEAIV